MKQVKNLKVKNIEPVSTTELTVKEVLSFIPILQDIDSAVFTVNSKVNIPESLFYAMKKYRRAIQPVTTERDELLKDIKKLYQAEINKGLDESEKEEELDLTTQGKVDSFSEYLDNLDVWKAFLDEKVEIKFQRIKLDIDEVMLPMNYANAVEKYMLIRD